MAQAPISLLVLWNPTSLTTHCPSTRHGPVGVEVPPPICLNLITWSLEECAPPKVRDVQLELVISSELRTMAFLGRLFRNEWQY